jgi:hypothetical protein
MLAFISRSFSYLNLIGENLHHLLEFMAKPLAGLIVLLVFED